MGCFRADFRKDCLHLLFLTSTQLYGTCVPSFSRLFAPRTFSLVLIKSSARERHVPYDTYFWSLTSLAPPNTALQHLLQVYTQEKQIIERESKGESKCVIFLLGIAIFL